MITNSPPDTSQNSLHFVSDDSWTEGTITWNNQPAVASLIEVKDVPFTAGEWLEHDVTNIVNTEMAGDGILSFRLSEFSVDNLYAFASKEGGGTGFAAHIVFDSVCAPPQGSCDPAPLAVSWNYFTAIKQGGHARLDWSSFSDVGPDFFAVEWGTNGRDFNQIGTIAPESQLAAAGHNYLHENPVTGSNYYRIQQVDINGEVSYSNIQHLYFHSDDLK